MTRPLASRALPVGLAVLLTLGAAPSQGGPTTPTGSNRPRTSAGTAGDDGRCSPEQAGVGADQLTVAEWIDYASDALVVHDMANVGDQRVTAEPAFMPTGVQRCLGDQSRGRLITIAAWDERDIMKDCQDKRQREWSHRCEDDGIIVEPDYYQDFERQGICLALNVNGFMHMYRVITGDG